jgi:membrane dipeptidase
MIIVDAHEDIAYNSLAYNRDYTRSVSETRRLEAHLPQRRNGTALLGLPDALSAGVALVFATLFAAPRSNQPEPWDSMTYRDAREAYRLGMNQLDYYLRLQERDERVRLVTTAADLDAVLATWEGFTPPPPITALTDPEEAAARREQARDDATDRARELAYRRRYDLSADLDAPKRVQGMVLLMENGDPIIEPAQFEEWYARGLRIVGPAWRASRYSGGWTQPGPLTDLGRELLDVMASFNTILDLSHIAEEAFLEAVDRYEGVLIASHSNPRRFSNSDRHLSDTMIRLLAERDGVMGVVIYNRYLSHSWVEGDPKDRVPFSVILDIIDHVCQLTGSAAHVGIGTDFDGGYGAESIPDGMNSIADLTRIAEGLRGRGYAEDDIVGIMGGNLLRRLRQALPTS